MTSFTMAGGTEGQLYLLVKSQWGHPREGSCCGEDLAAMFQSVSQEQPPQRKGKGRHTKKDARTLGHGLSH